MTHQTCFTTQRIIRFDNIRPLLSGTITGNINTLQYMKTHRTQPISFVRSNQGGKRNHTHHEVTESKLYSSKNAVAGQCVLSSSSCFEQLNATHHHQLHDTTFFSEKKTKNKPNYCTFLENSGQSMYHGMVAGECVLSSSSRLEQLNATRHHQLHDTTFFPKKKTNQTIQCFLENSDQSMYHQFPIPPSYVIPRWLTALNSRNQQATHS
jgi:hypothetical protein